MPVTKLHPAVSWQYSNLRWENLLEISNLTSSRVSNLKWIAILWIQHEMQISKHMRKGQIQLLEQKYEKSTMLNFLRHLVVKRITANICETFSAQTFLLRINTGFVFNVVLLFCVQYCSVEDCGFGWTSAHHSLVLASVPATPSENTLLPMQC